MTSTALNNHLSILLENDRGRLVEVEDGDARQLGGRALRLGRVEGVHQVHQGLDDGVVRGVHVGVKGERTFAVAIEGFVPVGGDDPVLKLEV